MKQQESTSRSISELQQTAITVLKKLVQTPSFSVEEHGTAEILIACLQDHHIEVHRTGNNVWAKNRYYDKSKPTILLNSHHDTVRPNDGYKRDPFVATVEDGKLFGLGSNDAGASLVSLLATFLYYHNEEGLKYNLVFAASAEEENSGTGGIELVLPDLGPIDFALVGEPTKMQMAVAEKGLMVLDCIATGKPGHAAREEGINAIYLALKDMEWFRSYQFPLVSDLLGPVKMSVTVIHAGDEHNVVPGECSYTVDVRVNECYSFEDVLSVIRENISSTITPRSLRMRSSAISLEHPIVEAGKQLGLTYYGSPTTSDKALMPFPALKIGVGDSARSHMADEYVYVSEIHQGIQTYIDVLKAVVT